MQLKFPANHSGDGGIFVTGTDTDIGKTRVALGLMELFKNRGLKVSAMKPVASGCHLEAGKLRNPDAILLRRHASTKVEYETVNPYAFEPPVSPHIAAKQVGVEICISKICEVYKRLQNQSDLVVVEGVGGWQVPLNDTDRVSSLAGKLGLPVVLVVGLRLGCLNHALLTAAAIQQSGCRLLGWVGNRIDPGFLSADANIQTLRDQIAAPLLGLVPFAPKLDSSNLSEAFDIAGWQSV